MGQAERQQEPIGLHSRVGNCDHERDRQDSHHVLIQSPSWRYGVSRKQKPVVPASCLMLDT